MVTKLLKCEPLVYGLSLRATWFFLGEIESELLEVHTESTHPHCIRAVDVLSAGREAVAGKQPPTKIQGPLI